jgi:hypothetical protein
VLQFHPSITSHLFPVSFLLVAGGLLSSSSLFAQDKQQTKIPENQWINLPDFSIQQPTEPQVYVTAKPATPGIMSAVRAQALAAQSTADTQASATLPLWFYNVVSSRDSSGYFGIMIGNDPFHGGGTARVPTYIVPVILRTNTVGVNYNPTTGVFTTVPGVTTFDPTAADNACMTEPNNVPATVFRQSPIFENAKFTFGGTDVGYTQYLDAFQRASFWKILPDQNDYHVFLDPVNQLGPVVIDVPAIYGTTRPTSSTLRSVCGPLGIVDINWLDFYLSTVVLPALTAQGVNSGSFPVFQLYNVVGSSRVTSLGFCCILGYHSVSEPPIQTYAVADFDTSNFFSAGAQDTGILSHEIGEWINDPFVSNVTPRWGHTGQVGGCQGNLETGDPLSGSLAPSVIMPNGFTYRLQEMAFYSWFLGAPSIAVNGWYSNNGSFLKDAGPPCR